MDDYTVPFSVRLGHLLPGEVVLGPDTVFEYSWDHGYEHLYVRLSPDHGSLEYRGSYHPKGYCEGGGSCVYCGRTLHDDFT